MVYIMDLINKIHLNGEDISNTSNKVLLTVHKTPTLKANLSKGCCCHPLDFTAHTGNFQKQASSAQVKGYYEVCFSLSSIIIMVTANEL